MKVLWVSRFIPFPMNSGDRVYSARLASAAAGAGMDLAVLGIADGPVPADAGLGTDGPNWNGVSTAQTGTIPALLRSLPLVVERASPPPMVAAFKRLAQAFAPQAVVIDNYAAGWAWKLLDAVPSKPALIYIAHNFEEKLADDIARGFTGSLPRKIALNLNARKIRKLERGLVAASDLVVALTERDRDDLLVRHPGKPSLILPPGFTGYRAEQRVIDATVPRRVVMLGSVRWIAKQINVGEFLEAADGKFRDAGITFDIIGDVDEEFREKWTPRLKATRFLGFVDDLAAELASSRLGLIVEAVGGGFKLKILDYLFARVPVAALDGSFEGVPEAARNEILIKPSADQLANSVISIIDDFPTLNRMQDRCFDAVHSHFDWKSNGQALAKALRELRPV